MDPDPGPGGRKTYGSDGSGSATLVSHNGWQFEAMSMKKTSR